MVSQIDSSFITSAPVSKSLMRQNLDYAEAEISRLQEVGPFWIGNVGGTSTALTGNVGSNVNVNALTDGLTLVMRFSTVPANNASFQLNAFPALPIKYYHNGALVNITTTLLTLNMVARLIYSGANNCWIVDSINVLPGGSGGNTVYVTPQEFGALGDNTTDDTVAIAAAINSGRMVVFPAGVYFVTGGFTVSTVGQRILSCGRTLVRFRMTGSYDLFTITANQVEISGFDFRGSTQGGTPSPHVGNVFYLDGAENVILRDHMYTDIYTFARLRGTFYTVIANVRGSILRGPHGIRMEGTDADQAHWLVLTASQFGGGTSITSPAAGLDLDGNVATIHLLGVGFVNCDRGMWVRNTVGATAAAAFIHAHGFGCDYPQKEAIRIEDSSANSFFFTETYAHGSQTESMVYITNGVRRVYFLGGQITGAWKHGFDVNCTDGVFDIHSAWHSNEALGKYSAMRINSLARNIIVRGKFGRDSSNTGPNNHLYGVDVAQGAQMIRIEANVGGNNVAEGVRYSVDGFTNVYELAPSGVAGTSLSSGTVLSNRVGFGCILEPVLVGGALSSVTVVSGGRGFNVAPTVQIFGDGVGATATANVTDGTVSSITVTNPGSGYTWMNIVAHGGAGTPRIRPLAPNNNNTQIAVQASGRSAFIIGNDITPQCMVVDHIMADMRVPPQLPSFPVGGLPAAASFPRCMIYVSNGSSNRRLAISDGTNWRFPDGAIVS